MATRKRKPAPTLFIMECPECDYYTWVWTCKRQALDEFVEHYLEVHRGEVDIMEVAE